MIAVYVAVVCCLAGYGWWLARKAGYGLVEPASRAHDRGAGSSRPYSWSDDQELAVLLWREELAGLPEVEEPVA